MRYYISTMNSNGSPQVLFALIIGIAIVSGAVIFNNFAERLASAPSITESSVPQELPDLQASSMRQTISDSAEGPTWQQTIPEQNVPEINIRPTISGTYEPPTTLARQFGVDLFTTVVEAGANDLSPEEFENRLSSLTQRYADTASAQQYTGADIQTTLESDAQAIRTYMNTVATIFIEHTPENTRGRAELFRAIAESQDQQAQAELLRIADNYQTMREQYLATAVPHRFVTAHVALINTVEAIHNDIRSIANFIEDPLAGQLGIRRYPSSSQAFTRALQNLGVETIRHQEVFDFDEDPALLFILTLPDVS